MNFGGFISFPKGMGFRYVSPMIKYMLIYAVIQSIQMSLFQVLRYHSDPCDYPWSQLENADIATTRRILLQFYEEFCPIDHYEQEFSYKSVADKSKETHSQIDQDEVEAALGSLMNKKRIDVIPKSDSQDQLPSSHSVVHEVKSGERKIVNQRAELMNLYETLSGERWTNSTLWGSSVPICYWEGIMCYSQCSSSLIEQDLCPVVVIQRPGIGIRGKMINFQMPYLNYLIIPFNYISGTIPDFNFPNLRLIWMANNELSGTLPEFQNCPKLSVLAISNNRLSGSLPEFSFLNELSEVYLPENTFTGDPPIFEYSPNMKIFGLQMNRFTGTLTDLANIPKLEQFDLSRNFLTGTIPDFRLPVAKLMDLNTNDLEGSLPNFQYMPFMVDIYVYSNQLNGTIPNFRKMPIIQALAFHDNYFFGNIPTFEYLPRLYICVVMDNNLDGTIPKYESNMNVFWFDFSNNYFVGTIPEYPHMKNMAFLYASDNLLEGTLPTFEGMSMLSDLTLSGNKFSGTVPSFSSIKLLSNLQLALNSHTGTIPAFKNPLLSVLDLSGNNLVGTIPDLSRLLLLEVMRLSENSLEGPVPTFENNIKMQKISFQMNQLAGSLPPLQLPLLKVLDLSRNHLSGSINPLMSMPNVTLINLSRNQLAGYIPPAFENFIGLQSILLSNNKLEGTIPKGIWELDQLIVIDLSSNNFTGDIGPFLAPEDLAGETDSAKYIFLDNNQFFGKLDWWLLTVAGQIEEISIRNNKITHLGDLTVSNSWKRIDLSGNPLYGTIPNSYHRFVELQQISLVNTPLHHDNSTLLPSFTRFGDPYNLQDKRSLYVCPSVVTKVLNLNTDINIEPMYYDFAACECLPNYFGQAGKCVQCPRECDCSDGISLRGCYVTPDLRNIAAVERCAQPESCVLLLNPVTADDSDVPFIEQDCGRGYEGESCSKCESGYGHVGRTCIECNDTTTYVSISLGLYFLLCYIVHLYKMNDNYSAKLRILMFHGQTLSILASVVPGSSRVNSAVDWSYSIGSLHVPNVECVLGSNSMVDSFIFSLVRILIIYTISMIIYVFKPNLRIKIVIVLLQLLFLFYFGIARHVFSVMGCTVYDTGRDTWYLNAAPWIECDPESDEYEILRAMMIPTIVIYILGLPIYAWWCLKGRFSGISGAEQKIAFFYRIYQDKYWYWELVIIARRLAFAFATSVIPFTYPGALFSAIVFIIQISLWLQMKYEPYAAKDENTMELMSLQVIFLSFFLALLANLLEQETWIIYVILSTNAATFMWFIYDSILIPSIRYMKGGSGNQNLVSVFTGGPAKTPSYNPKQDEETINIGLSTLVPRDDLVEDPHAPTLPGEDAESHNEDPEL